MGHIVTSNVICAMSAAQAWEKLRDLSLAHNYVPNIDKTQITTEKKEGVGASRRVSGKQSLDETVTEWKEGKGFTIRLHNGDKPVTPFKEATFTYRIDAIDDTQCKLTTTMIYELPWGFFGNLLNTLLIGRIVRGNIRDVVLSMKGYYETNKPITKSDLAELRKIPEEKLPQPYG